MTTTFTSKDIRHSIETVAIKSKKTIPVEINRTLVSEWAEENRVLTEGPFQGPFSFDVVPYLREIADALSPCDSETREVVFKKPARIGATVSVGENWIGATIDAFPCDIGYITSDGAMAEIQMQTRIDALINESGIGYKIGDVKKRATQKKTMDKTILKAFPGGTLLAGGPNSSFFKRSVGFKFLNVTELDGFADDIGKEGDPVGLFRRRCGAYQDDYKILWESSPKLKHNSKITRLYKEGDQRKYLVPCKHCGHLQELKWGDKDKPGGLKFKHDDDDRLIEGSVHYECEKCGGHWKNEDKDFFLPDKKMGGKAFWKPTASPRKKGVKSYSLNALYAPVGFISWETIVVEFLELKHKGFPRLEFQVWINTVLGEPFEERGGRPKIEALLSRKKTYLSGTLPEDAKPLLITVGADVQGGENSRIECEVVAWGRDFESWSIRYEVIPGDTGDLDSPCWSALRSIITTKYAGMQPTLSGVDSGYNTETVYSFCDTFESGVHPVMGQTYLNKDRKYIQPTECIGHKHFRIDVNDNLLKQEIYSFIAKGEFESGNTPRGYCHFPSDYPRQHFIQLTNEQRVMERDNRGVAKLKWIQTGKNEQLDCRKYALAMVYAYREYVEAVLKENGNLEEDTVLSWHEFWDYLEG